MASYLTSALTGVDPARRYEDVVEVRKSLQKVWSIGMITRLPGSLRNYAPFLFKLICKQEVSNDMRVIIFLNILQSLSHQTLVTLLESDPSLNTDQPIPSVYPLVTFAYMKHMWKCGQRVS